MDVQDPIALALAAADALANANVRHALYGGLLLAAYGDARETRDADLAVLDAGAVGAMNAMVAAGLDVRVAFEDVRFGGLEISRLTVFGAHELNTVDLVRPREPSYAARVLQRAVRAPLRDRTIDVVSIEDFVLLKALSTRDKDLDDAASVLRRSGAAIDRDLLAREADVLVGALADVPVAARMEEILRRGGP